MAKKKIDPRFLDIDVDTSNHNGLSGIQGGATDGEGHVTEAYHLTQQEHDNAIEAAELLETAELIGILDDASQISHNGLQNIDGGTHVVDSETDTDTVTEAYHLSEQEHSDVLSAISTVNEAVALGLIGDAAVIDHNTLQDIQGGAQDGEGVITEAYHFTQEEHDNAIAAATLLENAEALGILGDTSRISHNVLQNIQGGTHVIEGEGEDSTDTVTEAYHLSAQEYADWQELYSHYDEIMALLGGNS